ncbi:hypothetical protein AQUCO_02900101v1 [Aquilegia coerulea]|uniref:Uncharacterized protein n=1 Tax=Aquilegia coerulea TaxID=218851 RepID=A0A2G5D3F5_AQUCA|nr:hypothetical protein AQUCO_02900101v1 [Aquilegia coerulea]
MLIIIIFIIIFIIYFICSIRQLCCNLITIVNHECLIFRPEYFLIVIIFNIHSNHIIHLQTRNFILKKQWIIKSHSTQEIVYGHTRHHNIPLSREIIWRHLLKNGKPSFQHTKCSFNNIS